MVDEHEHVYLKVVTYEDRIPNQFNNLISVNSKEELQSKIKEVYDVIKSDPNIKVTREFELNTQDFNVLSESYKMLQNFNERDRNHKQLSVHVHVMVDVKTLKSPSDGANDKINIKIGPSSGVQGSKFIPFFMLGCAEALRLKGKLAYFFFEPDFVITNGNFTNIFKRQIFPADGNNTAIDLYFNVEYNNTHVGDLNDSSTGVDGYIDKSRNSKHFGLFKYVFLGVPLSNDEDFFSGENYNMGWNFGDSLTSGVQSAPTSDLSEEASRSEERSAVVNVVDEHDAGGEKLNTENEIERIGKTHKLDDKDKEFIKFCCEQLQNKSN